MSNQENEQVDQKQQDGEHAYGRLVGQQIIYLLEELTTLVGRDEECDIVFDSKSISKKHASIHFLDEEGLRCELIDHMSRNGCFVNEDRVWNSKRNLEHGDTIRFGYDIVSFRFEYTNPMAVARGASVLQDSPFSSPFTSPERGGSSPSTSPERKKMDPADMPVAGVSSSELNENQAKNSIFGRRAFTMVTQPPPPASSYSSSQQQRVSASSASSPFSQSRQPHHPQHMNPMEYSQMKYSSQKTQSLPEEEQNEQQNRESLSTTSRRYDHSRSPSSASSEMQRSNTLRQRSDSDRPLLNKSPLQQDPRRSPLPSNVERPQTARDNWRDRPVVLEPRLMSSLGRREAEDLYGLPYRSEGERKMDERLMASAPVRRRPEFSERSWRRESKKYDDDDEDSDDDYDSSDESYGRRSKHLHRTSRSLHTSSRRKKSKPKKKKQGKESESSSESSQSESDSSESSEKNKKSPQKDISKSSSKSSKGGLEEDAAKLNETETQSPSSANPVSAQIPQSSYPSLPNQLSAPYPPAIPSPAVFSSPQAPNYAVERHMEELRMRGRESDISIARLEAERRVKTEMEMASLREKIAKEEGKKEAEQEIAQKIGGQSALSASLRRNSHRPLINEITEDSDEDDDTARGRQNISSRQSVLSTPSSRRQLDSDRSQNRMRSVLNRAKSDQMSLSKALTSPTLVSPLSDPALSSMSTARKIHHIASSCRSALDTLIAQCLERAECGLDESAVSETGQSADPEEERVFLSMSVAQLEKAREAVGLWDPMAPDGKALPIIPRRISASGKDEIDENASNFREQNQRLVEKEEQVRKLEQDVIVLQNEGEKMRKLLRMHQIDPSTGVADFDQSDSSNMAGDALSAQLKDAKDTVDELRRLITHKNEEIEYLKAATADLMANNSTMATSSSPSSSASKQGRVTDLLEAQRLNEELNERLSSQILHWTQLMRVNEELQFQVDQLTKMQHAREEDFIKMKSEMNQKTAEYEKKLCEIATSGRAYSRENDPSALKSSSSASDSNQQTYTEGGIQAAAQALVDKLAEEETAIVAIKGQDAIFRQQLMSLDEERTRLRVEVETLQQQPAQQEIDRLRSELTQLKAGVDPAKVIQMEQSLGKLHDECWRLKEEKAILLNQLKGEGGSDKTIEDSGNYHPPQELFEKGGQQTANFLGRNADSRQF
ncbi:putative FHA domain [Monocercomonoides exilis]|uniref:putative FHA domain n=1 Tax=Monocercomonoides exilis TaxID=2049356 RepID=UPI003559A09F|nr:putative FHA domain [Monocercomonoides exilis]